MRQWYSHVGGEQYGPLDEEVLRSWISEGRVKPTDYVWSEGMRAWEPAQSVFPELFALPGVPVPPINSMVSVAPPEGTDGQTPNGELMAQARQLLRGRWGLPIGFSFLLSLIQGAASSIPSAGTIVGLIVGAPLELSRVIFYLTFVRGGKPRLGMLTAGFKNFANALVAQLLITIFVFLWSLLLIIPGIVAALAYSQTFYLLAEDRSLDGLEAIRKSKEIMRGRKWKFFCLGLRFVGWALLCALTLGIGFLWLWPYMSVSFARFYDDLKPPFQAAPSSAEPTPLYQQ